MSEPRRLYAKTIPAPGARLELDPDAARHARVLRLRPGDRVVLFDGRGTECDARLDALAASACTCTVERLHPRRDDAARVVLVQALPKGSKLEEIVRAATEAGVTSIHLAVAERSIARPDEDRARARVDRLAKIATEAARQSERGDVPTIVPPAPLLDVAARAPATAARLVLSPRAGAPWADALAGHDEVWLAVGPEGGLSEGEEDALVAAGWSRARIAVPILRVETAAPLAVALTLDRIASRTA